MDSGSRISLAGMVLLLIGLSLLVGWALSAPASADPGTTLYAAPDGATSGACDSWANACTLQYALSKAQSGDQIWVKKGIHKPTTNPSDRGASFTLQKGVALYGGFAGTETSLSQRNWQANITVLSGDIDNNDITDANGVVTTTAHISGSNSYHVVRSGSVTSSAILDGFVITAGQADDASFPDASFPDNSGGGMLGSFTTATLRNLIFSGNLAAQQGGGMWHSKCSMTLTNVTFRGNTAAQGGGMYNSSCEPTLTDVTFEGNHAAQQGGGMYNEGIAYRPTLMNVTFRNNTAAQGGGMYNSSCEPTLTDVTFINNTATGDGGGMLNDHSNPTLNRVTFRGNTAGWNGGGMLNHYSNPTVINALFSGNAATGGYPTGLGGGMFNFESSPTLTNTTFGGNTATRYGGGMGNYQNSKPRLTNVIMWGNSFLNLFNVDSTPTIAYSDCGGCGVGGTGNIDADPLFVNLAGGNLRLQPGSPCIDKGNNAALPPSITTDLDGNPRIFNGVVDMGAYEARYRYVYLPVVRK